MNLCFAHQPTRAARPTGSAAAPARLHSRHQDLFGLERVNTTVCKKFGNKKVTYSLKMSKLQTMVELTEKHVPQDSTCVRGRNLTLGSARLYTLGVFLVLGVFSEGYSALGQCLFHLIQQVAKQGGIAAFPIYGYRVLSLGKKEKRNPLVPLPSREDRDCPAKREREQRQRNDTGRAERAPGTPPALPPALPPTPAPPQPPGGTTKHCCLPRATASPR